MYVPLGVFSLITFVIGVPGLLGLLLWRHRRALQSSMSVMSVYGHMYLRYQPNKWYWEALLQVCGGAGSAAAVLAAVAGFQCQSGASPEQRCGHARPGPAAIVLASPEQLA
jgi:hypothetical protein